MRTRIAAVGTALEALAAVLLGAALVRVVIGPQTFHLAGAEVSVRTLSRPLIAAALVLVVRAFLVRTADGGSVALIAASARAVVGAVVCAGVMAWFALFSITCGGADSYGYVSAAQRLLDGRVVQEEPLARVLPFADAIQAATPLGYTPSPRVVDASVPVYPLGLPLLMAGFTTVVGPLGAFVVAPTLGAVLLVSVFISTHALTRDRLLALTATALTAVHPVVFTYSIQPMSDVPAAAFFLIAVAALVHPRPRPILAGLAAAFCLLIRPALAPALVALVALPAVVARRVEVRPAVRFAAPLACGVAVQLGMQWYLYGHPLANGYAEMGALFALERAGANTRSHLYWAWRALGPVFLAATLIGLAVTNRTLRLTVILVTLTVSAPHIFYRTFDHWETLRFLLPALVLLTLPAAAGLVAIAGRVAGRTGGPLLVALLVAAIASGWSAWLRSNNVFSMPEYEARYRHAAQLVEQVTPVDAVVLAELHSGSLRYYARRASANWNRIPAGAMPTTVAALRRHGHRVYLLLDSDEERRSFEQKHGPTADWWPGGQRRNVQLFEAP